MHVIFIEKPYQINVFIEVVPYPLEEMKVSCLV